MPSRRQRQMCIRDRDGEVGAACLKWSFDHAVYKNGVNELRNVKGML